jgi:hypothetical protein
MFFNYIGFSLFWGVLMLLVFGILQWLHISAGNIIDWLIGIASFWWLIVIVTVPWNIYFDAQEVIAEAAISQDKDIPVDLKQFNYVKKISRGSIIVALVLHILSAIGLYLLAITGISPVAYVSSGATLLLTALRPAIRAYQYLAMRLSRIREQIKYPREDVVELRDRFKVVENTVKELQEKFDESKSDSWVSNQQKEWQEIRQSVANLKAVLEQFKAQNQVEHQQLTKDSQNAIAQITEDGQFLNHVREIIRFFKTA